MKKKHTFTGGGDGAEDEFEVVRFSSFNTFGAALWLLGVARPGLGGDRPAHQGPQEILAENTGIEARVEV